MHSLNKRCKETRSRLQVALCRYEAVRSCSILGGTAQVVERLNECRGSAFYQVFVPFRSIENPFATGGQEKVGIDEERESCPCLSGKKREHSPISRLRRSQRKRDCDPG